MVIYIYHSYAHAFFSAKNFLINKSLVFTWVCTSISLLICSGSVAVSKFQE